MCCNFDTWFMSSHLPKLCEGDSCYDTVEGRLGRTNYKDFVQEPEANIKVIWWSESGCLWLNI